MIRTRWSVGFAALIMLTSSWRLGQADAIESPTVASAVNVASAAAHASTPAASDSLHVPDGARAVELHSRIVTRDATDKRVALTLDACAGLYDAELIDFLIAQRIPATIFATKQWLDHNPTGRAVLRAHPDLFDIENHGEHHIPAVIGKGRKVYGIAGAPDVLHLRREVENGAQAVEDITGEPSRWYRAATARYDEDAVEEIQRLGYRIAGFSVNADAGATLPQAEITARLKHVQAGDIILAHMNKPHSQTAEGLRPGLLALQQRGLVFVHLNDVAVQTMP